MSGLSCSLVMQFVIELKIVVTVINQHYSKGQQLQGCGRHPVLVVWQVDHRRAR